MPDALRSAAESANVLPPGTRLHEFELKGLLGVGGFGIVYLAFDHALEREVAIKEYMPASMAGRTETMHVSLRSQSDAEIFALGLRSFVNEAKLLARFDHPSLLKVHRFWEANGTAYTVMPVLRGQTLKDVRQGAHNLDHPIDEAWLRQMLPPLLGALETLHAAGVYHRDIAPDNIQIEPDGRAVLMDFGAARRVISDKTQTLTAILKPAYAPIEQYAEAASVRQGPWTDLYALGATLHYMLLGHAPEPATARAISDDQAPISQRAIAGCSEDFLHIIDWMLAPRPNDRPQSVAALREVLDGRVAPPQRRPAASVQPSQWERTQLAPTMVASPARTDIDLSAAPEAEATVIDPTVPPLRALAAAPPPAAAPAAAAAVPASGRRVGLMAGGALLAAALLAFVFWPRGGVQPAAVPVAGAASAAGTAASMAGGGAAESPVAGANTAAPELKPARPSAATGPSAPARPAPAPPSAARTEPAPAPARSDSAKVPAASPAPPVASNPPVVAPSPSAAPAAAPAPAAAVTATPAPAVPTAAPPAEPPRAQTPPQSAPPTPAIASAAVPSGPNAQCSSRDNPLSYFVCMERECLRSRWTNHADCLKWRQSARPRDTSGN